ncbi:hypothetical protein [Mesorhizobium sp. KR1-2]|uniref:hypothetical protein n=1 Tax=Mesorhizobium sp. KR1-2 TaxID=3156609 RepID=UPI0032B5C5A2
MDKPKSKLETLCGLIAAEIAANPFHLDGYAWCAMPQPAIAAKLDFSVETLRRLISKPPIVRQTKKVDGKNVTLLRVGEPGPVTADDIAKEMSRLLNGRRKVHRTKWGEERQTILASMDMLQPAPISMGLKRVMRLDKLLALPRHTTKREFGCMIGLAEIWPDGHQVEMFKMVLKRWPIFMAGVKWAAVMEAETDEQVFNRHLEFPSVSVMRRYAHVAIEMATMDAQEKGKVPAWLKALTPGIWPKPKA